MKISAKGRYALAATTIMAEKYISGEHITVVSISDKLGISKIYLEQVFSLLKRGGIVNSTQGAQGGYKLTKSPSQTTVFDVLSAVELSLVEPSELTVSDNAPEIEAALKITVFDILDDSIKQSLSNITLDGLVAEAEKHKTSQELMYYI